MIEELSMINSETPGLWHDIVENESLKSPFSKFTWHKLWFDILGFGWQPFALLVNKQVIAPFAHKQGNVIFSGGMEIADYLDIIGPDDIKLNAWSEIIDYLKRVGISSLHLFNVPQSSPTVTFFKNLYPNLVEQEDTTPIIKLPQTWNEYSKGLTRKYRHELRRKLRKFERDNKQVEIEVCTNPRKCRELFRLMRLNPQKRVFLTPKMEKFMHQVIIKFQNEIKLLLLKVNASIVAATLSFMYPNTELLYNSGFDEQFSGAGFYLKAKSIEKAILNGQKEYNFLQGSERYKYELGGTNFFVYTINLKL